MTAKINEMRERFLEEYNEAQQQHMSKNFCSKNCYFLANPDIR